MGRWWVATLVVATGAALGTNTSTGLPTGGTRPAGTLHRPNILLIVTDDQRASEGTLKVMPSTRRWLKKRGIRYARAFATTPLCCPSRASIFTGRYAHNHGVYTNEGKPNFNHDFTFQAYLDDAGYKTAMAGKFFNDWPLRQRPPNFDRWAMFDGGYHNRRFNVDGTMRDVAAYSTDFLARKTVDFLDAFERRDRRPWLMYVAPYAPHATYVPADRHKGSKVPPWNGNPAVFEKDRSDKPAYVLLRNETYETWKRNRRLQLRTLKSVDQLVGRVKRKLRGLKERSDTMVVFMSDNGYMWADHGLYDKGAPYTPSIRIPMLMRIPGRPGGVRDGRLVANIDVAPTILDAAGVTADPSHPMDGKSLIESGFERDRILTEYRNNDNRWTPPTWASLRTRSYQYTEYYEDGTRIFREYYDLKTDPWQLRNLLKDGNSSNNPTPTTLATLSAQLQMDRTCAATTCP